MNVPFFRSPWQSNPAEATQRLAAILVDGAYVLGREVAAFEAEFSAWLGGRPVAGVNSGTDALVLAMKALGIGPGDEVILPSYTFYACFEAVVRVGAVPVLVDTSGQGYLPGLGQIEAAITPATRAILAVPLFGETSGLSATQQFCQRHGLFLIEDVAQACGGMVESAGGEMRLAGTLGDASAFSFYPTKNLGAAGDAGAVSFRDPVHAERCLALRNHGFAKGWHTDIGLNSRLDELQAGLLRMRLQNLAADQTRRCAVADRYLAAWAGLPGLQLPAAHAGHAWNYFVVCHPLRDRLRQKLTEAGIDTRIYYTHPIHCEPAYRERYSTLRLPNCERLAEQSLALPMYPDLTDQQVALVIDAIERGCLSLAREA